MKEEIESINDEYYDELYKSYGIIDLIYPKISFDQQSKSRDNYQLLKKHFNGQIQGKRILDFGCGFGTFLLKFPSNNELFGTDISMNAISKLPRVAKFYGKRIDAFLYSEIDSHIPDNSLDVISLSHVLEHVPNDVELLQQLKRKLKPDGVFLINLPVNEVWEDPKHLRKYDEESIVKLMNSIGHDVGQFTYRGRINGYLLNIEKNKKPNIIVRIAIKLLRIGLGISALMQRLLEKRFTNRRVATHILFVAQEKPND